MSRFVRSESRTRVIKAHHTDARCPAGTGFGSRCMAGPLHELLKRADG